MKPPAAKPSISDTKSSSAMSRTENLLQYGGLLEMSPGKFMKMRGTKAVQKAIQQGKASIVKCTCCNGLFQVRRKARALYCRNCQQFTPLTPELGQYRKRSSSLSGEANGTNGTATAEEAGGAGPTADV
jgi:hypothetical protein